MGERHHAILDTRSKDDVSLQRCAGGRRRGRRARSQAGKGGRRCRRRSPSGGDSKRGHRLGRSLLRKAPPPLWRPEDVPGLEILEVPAWYWHSTTYQLVHHVHQLVGSCSELSRQLRWVDSYPDGAGSIWRCNGPGASLYRHQDQE